MQFIVLYIYFFSGIDGNKKNCFPNISQNYFKILFICLKGKVRQKWTNTSTLVYSQNSHKGWAGSGSSQEPKTPSGTPAWVQGSNQLSHIPLPSPVYLQGVGSEVEQRRVKLAPLWDAGVTCSDFTCYSTTPAPSFFKYFQSVVSWIYNIRHHCIVGTAF